jgi:hypothetical protein
MLVSLLQSFEFSSRGRKGEVAQYEEKTDQFRGKEKTHEHISSMVWCTLLFRHSYKNLSRAFLCALCCLKGFQFQKEDPVLRAVRTEKLIVAAQRDATPSLSRLPQG